ncbi:hypothetical protein SALBM311S_07659 [Streptomyces alboniger]
MLVKCFCTMTSFGQITFAERLPKNEDKRLSDIVEKFSTGGSSKKLILTTREYILRDAKRNYERLNDLDSTYHFLLELKAYNKADRAQILYNHLWHSDVSASCLREIAEGGYKKIIEHRSYNPRLIEYCTGKAFDLTSPGYPARFKSTLDHPERIWKIAFEKHLTMEQQLLVLVLCTLPRSALLDTLQEAHAALCGTLGVVSTEASFKESLDVLEGTFIAISKSSDRCTFVRHLNPSVTEFALARIAADRTIITAIVKSSVFFEQLSELFSYGRGGSALRPGSKALISALDKIKEEFLHSMATTLHSQSSTQMEVQVDQEPIGVLIEPPEKLETRVQFYLQLDAEWDIGHDATTSALDALIARWRTKTGSKSYASMILKTISEHPIAEALKGEAHDAVHTWFEQTLYDTDDWYQYTQHLWFYDGVQLDESPDIASEFEHFMDNRLSRDDLPDDLDDMKGLADDFGLEDLSERLGDILRDQYEPDDDYEPDGSRVREEDGKDSDEYIADLFGRLGE